MRVLSDETRHPFRLQCEQFKLTQEAVKMLKAYPHVTVLFDHRVEQVLQDESGVTVYAEALADGFHEYRAKYCVGTDGANSRVRKSQGINFQGFTYPERFLVVSTPFDLATLLPKLTYVNYISDPDEWCVLLKTVTLWRVLVPVDAATPDAELLTEANAQKVLQRIAPREVPYEVAHRTIYRVHQRVAVTYRKGRVLLAGDSAHINNPLGGMGMNGGLHDAFNLAPRLVAVLKGEADESTFDQYDRQRREICVRFVQDQTIKNKKAIEEKDPAARDRQMAEYKRMVANPQLARDFLRRGAMIASLREAAEIA
jgi:3-(3-hydroxy-phenyl)propionate hydroxylase